MKNIAFAFVLVSSSFLIGQTVDTYAFRLNLKVPRIYDNSKSLGYRKLQSQRITGELQLIYSDDGEVKIRVNNLVNGSHRINGRKITYTYYDYPYEGHEPLVVAIGNNGTGKFRDCGVEFAFQAEPSYNIGAVDEDNTLILELSGYGKIKNDVLRNIRGTVKGQIGCGCKAYGHVSPTRLYLGFVSDVVYDIAPLYGTFSASFRNRRYGPYRN